MQMVILNITIVLSKINYTLFFILLLIIGMLTGISFLMAFANDEGMGGLIHPFLIFRFPTHTLFWIYFSSTGTRYTLGLFINIFVNSFVLERLITFIRGISVRNHLK